MIEYIGYLGAFLLAICGLPSAIESYRKGHSANVNSWFLYIWYFGEIFTLAYVILKHGADWPLIFNYGLNLVFITVIIKYKLKPRS